MNDGLKIWFENENKNKENKKKIRAFFVLDISAM